MMDARLFEGFDPDLVAAICKAREDEVRQDGEAKACRIAQKMQLRRANSQAELAKLIPARIPDGESWHVISRGDIDALSFLSHAIGDRYFDYVAISTWCIARTDMDQLAAWLDAGRIDHLELYAGEIFPSQYGDEYEQAQQMVAAYGMRLVIARNHSKVTLACNEAEGYYLAIESSANVNTNPRIEQTAVHASRELFEFYREFFHGLRSIDRRDAGPAGAACARPEGLAAEHQ